MKQTTNYQLSQWEAQDRILREDFNADNFKTEQALGALQAGLSQQSAALSKEVSDRAAAVAAAQSALAAQIAKRGNCSIGVTTYTGTGSYGESNPTRINFSRRPTAFLVCGNGTLVVYSSLNHSTAFIIAQYNDRAVLTSATITWSGNQIQLVNSSNVRYQANDSGVTYQVIAFYQEA